MLSGCGPRVGQRLRERNGKVTTHGDREVEVNSSCTRAVKSNVDPARLERQRWHTAPHTPARYCRCPFPPTTDGGGNLTQRSRTARQSEPHRPRSVTAHQLRPQPVAQSRPNTDIPVIGVPPSEYLLSTTKVLLLTVASATPCFRNPELLTVLCTLFTHAVLPDLRLSEKKRVRKGCYQCEDRPMLKSMLPEAPADARRPTFQKLFAKAGADRNPR